MSDESVTVTERVYCHVEDGAMWRIGFSNGLHVWIRMAADWAPPTGAEVLLVYPNEREVWVHFPVKGRIYPFKFERGRFCA